MKISSMLSRMAIFLLLLSTILPSQTKAQTAEMTGERLAKARKEPQNWPTYFGAYDAWRYSPSTRFAPTT